MDTITHIFTDIPDEAVKDAINLPLNRIPVPTRNRKDVIRERIKKWQDRWNDLLNYKLRAIRNT